MSLYLLSIVCLLVHEVDAVKHREWRLLYVLRDMPDDRARDAFILLHYPLAALLLWSLLPSVPEIVRLGIAAFAIVHFGLHLRLRNAPEHEFRGALSWSAIAGAAVFGALYLVSVIL